MRALSGNAIPLGNLVGRQAELVQRGPLERRMRNLLLLSARRRCARVVRRQAEEAVERVAQKREFRWHLRPSSDEG